MNSCQSTIYSIYPAVAVNSFTLIEPSYIFMIGTVLKVNDERSSSFIQWQTLEITYVVIVGMHATLSGTHLVVMGLVVIHVSQDREI